MADLVERQNSQAPVARASGGEEVLSIAEAASALRVLRYGGVDEATTTFELPPAVRATVSPVIAALRWGAVLFGLAFAAPKAAEGDLAVVSTLAIVLYFTTWRTFRPLRLASHRMLHRAMPIIDSLIVSGAVGLSRSFDSPFIFVLLATATVAAFGWGLGMGMAALTISVLAMAVTGLGTNAGLNLDEQGSVVLLAAMIVVVAFSSFLRSRLLDAETRRASMTGRLDMLSETNDLLHILNQVARTLPTSLDMREALGRTRDQLHQAFGASVVAMIVHDETDDQWMPQLTEGCALQPAATTGDLPRRLTEALGSDHAVVIESLDGSGLSASSNSGLYTALRTRGKVIGVLAVEHGDVGHFGGRDERIIDGLAEALALTVDNARWFRRLRTLGAEEERVRIARDLHDRLGQWLTYISFELERIMMGGDESPELDNLYGDVQKAIEELRETLRQLRSGVTEDQPLEMVARELVQRFEHRTSLTVDWNVVNPGVPLRVPIENELLRILQEALNNTDKHAHASVVEITYDVDGDTGVLTIHDNGQGFDMTSGVRESAYGLVGMRERADVIGARLAIESAPGEGTTITVTASNNGIQEQ